MGQDLELRQEQKIFADKIQMMSTMSLLLCCYYGLGQTMHYNDERAYTKMIQHQLNVITQALEISFF